MGNRAVISFAKKPNPRSLGIYLHWNGGPESILAFVEAADALKIRWGDESYALARMVQIIGNFFGGRISVGIGTLTKLDCDNGDNGIYRIYRAPAGAPVVIQQSKRWTKAETRWCELDLNQVRKHPYWQPGKDGTPIVEEILAANRAFFAKGGDLL